MNFDITKWLHALQSTGTKYFLFAGIAFLIFYVLFAKAFRSIRIQQNFPRSKDYCRDIFYAVVSMTIFATISYVVFSALKPYNNIHYGTIREYGALYFALSFVWMFFLHDAYFYWIHRLMHLPSLYRLVHRVHHQSTNPSPWTAYAFHPIEAILEAGIAPLIAFTLPVNRYGFTLFMIFQLAYNVYGHLGYELIPAPWRKARWGQWINTSTAHNLHHHYFKGNYGLYTRIWDRLLKTESDKMNKSS